MSNLISFSKGQQKKITESVETLTNLLNSQNVRTHGTYYKHFIGKRNLYILKKLFNFKTFEVSNGFILSWELLENLKENNFMVHKIVILK